MNLFKISICLLLQSALALPPPPENFKGWMKLGNLAHDSVGKEINKLKPVQVKLSQSQNVKEIKTSNLKNKLPFPKIDQDEGTRFALLHAFD